MSTETASATLYKLTKADGTTRGGMEWGKGVSHEATGDESQDLCSDAWIHAYRSPELAVFMDPIHGTFGPEAQLWRAEGVVRKDDGTKVGCRQLRTVERLHLPTVTIEQRVTFGILCALRVSESAVFARWAVRWLSGKDRSASSAATAAAEAAAEAAEAAVWAAGTYAAEAAAYAAEAAPLFVVALAAADAAAAAAQSTQIDLGKIAKDALS